MTDTPDAKPDVDDKTASAKGEASTGHTLGQGLKLLVDVGPIAVFMITYNVMNRSRPEDAIFIATGVFIAATLAALVFSWIKEKRVPIVLVVSAVLVTFFGGLTLVLQDAYFIKIKPTIMNLLYAGVIFGSLFAGYNLWKVLFGNLFVLPDRIWRTLAVRWGCWFVFLAILNEFVWRNFSESFWANFKFWGVLPLTFLFALANIPITLKYNGRETEDAPNPPTAAGG